MHWIDPDSLSPVKSKVARFLFHPRGDADGMLLANGLEAHFPPHLSRKVLRRIRPGERVTLYGVKPRGAEMIACVAIESGKGVRIDDTGPAANGRKGESPENHRHADDDGLRRIEIEDTIERELHGPKGEVRGLLLSSSRIARFPPHAADGAQITAAIWSIDRRPGRGANGRWHRSDRGTCLGKIARAPEGSGTQGAPQARLTERGLK